MAASQDRVQKAIETLLKNYRDVVEFELEARAEIKRLGEANQKDFDDKVANSPALATAKGRDELPAKVPVEELVATVLYLNTGETHQAHFANGNIIEEVNEYIRDLAKNDPEAHKEFVQKYQAIVGGFSKRNQEIQQLAVELQGSVVGQTIFDTALLEPEEEGGDWTIVTVPITVDEKGPFVPETLDFGYSIGGYVAYPGQDLKNSFNIAAHAVPKGTKVEPFVVTTKNEADVRKMFIRTGHYEHGDHVHGLNEELPLMTKKDQEAFKAEQLRRMFGPNIMFL